MFTGCIASRIRKIPFGASASALFGRRSHFFLCCSDSLHATGLAREPTNTARSEETIVDAMRELAGYPRLVGVTPASGLSPEETVCCKRPQYIQTRNVCINFADDTCTLGAQAISPQKCECTSFGTTGHLMHWIRTDEQIDTCITIGERNQVVVTKISEGGLPGQCHRPEQRLHDRSDSHNKPGLGSFL